jgi:hypothetical protein
MIIAAVIESINPRTKTCTVNIPDLQSAADSDPAICEAVMLENPGIANSYKVGDLVWVGFIRGLKKYPIVIGRILTTATDYSNNGRAAVFDSLDISQTAQLPADTKFIQAETSYNSLSKLISKSKEALLQVGECKQSLIEQKQGLAEFKEILDEFKEILAALDSRLKIIEQLNKPTPELNSESETN